MTSVRPMDAGARSHRSGCVRRDTRRVYEAGRGMKRFADPVKRITHENLHGTLGVLVFHG